jgi:dihydrofolate synthase/folylpolyglutamate synthase
MSQAAGTLPDDYASALQLLYDRINYERVSQTPYTSQNYRLDRMRALLEQLGCPHQSYPIVHVAGTKGKGTTATLIYDVLRANGLKAGLYTSPHLLKLEERFQCGGLQCSSEQLVALARQALDAALRIEARGMGRPTFFEVTTAMGMLYFAQQRADCVVLEVGLGGRLDSTNVCQPIVTVVTSISLDHQAQLGHTIAEIAGEKAGIIKPGVPCISTARHPDAREVLQRVAAQQDSPLLLLDRDFEVSWQALPSSAAGDLVAAVAMQPNERPSDHSLSKLRAGDDAVAQVEYQELSQCYPDSPFSHSTWQTRLLGRHHADNLAGTVAVVNWLRSVAGWNLDPLLSYQAIAASHPPARLQIIGRHPIRIIDAAHNPISILAALKAIDDHFGSCHRVVVFASSRDKDYAQMLKHILEHCDRLIVTAFQENPRAVAPGMLCDAAVAVQCERGKNEQSGACRIIEIAETPALAWQRANAICPQNGLILAIGSFFLAAELMASLNIMHGESTV